MNDLFVRKNDACCNDNHDEEYSKDICIADRMISAYSNYIVLISFCLDYFSIVVTCGTRTIRWFTASSTAIVALQCCNQNQSEDEYPVSIYHYKCIQ